MTNTRRAAIAGDSAAARICLCELGQQRNDLGELRVYEPIAFRRDHESANRPEGRLAEASDEPLPDEAVAAKERQQRVQAALAALPPEQKEVVALAYLEGLSHSEIAERLGMPLGTVKSRMRIAYQKIRQTLENAE